MPDHPHKKSPVSSKDYSVSHQFGAEKHTGGKGRKYSLLLFTLLCARKANINDSPAACHRTLLTPPPLSVTSCGALSAPFNDFKFLHVLYGQLFHTAFPRALGTAGLYTLALGGILSTISWLRELKELVL